MEADRPSHGKDLMRILFLTSGDDVPSSRFRVLQYLPYLRQRGHDCSVAVSRPPKYRGWRWLGNRLSNFPRSLFRLADFMRTAVSRPDVVVIERELFSSNLALFERMFRRIAPALVLDVDDGLFLQHPRKFRLLAKMCDVVIAGNELIAEKSRTINPRTVVIPTALDLPRYQLKEEVVGAPKKLIVGWTGTAGNFSQLQTIAEPLRRLSREHDVELRIIAEHRPAPKLLGDGIDIRFQPWNRESEIDDLRQFDLGLMPLPDDEWSRYKCGLKILQYMACGIPAIASPVGVNADIIHHGQNGLLATSDEEWEAALQQLAGDADLRRRLAAAGRATVEERFSVEANVELLIAALTSATRHE